MTYLILICWLFLVGVAQAQTVNWTNTRTGATGTAPVVSGNWSIPTVSFLPGINPITVDSAGATGDSITITYTPPFPGNALVAAYAFKDGSGTNATDSSSNANTATLVNKATWTTQGFFDSAITFDPAGPSYVNVPDQNYLDFTRSFTISARVKPTTLAGTWRTIAAKGDQDIFPAAPLPLQYLYAWQTGSFGCVLGQVQAGFIPNGVLGTPQNICSTGPLATGLYSHVAVTYDALETPTPNLRLYINGALDKTTPASGIMQPSASAWKIGADDFASSGNDPFAGDIDEVRLYNYALPLTAGNNTKVNVPCGDANYTASGIPSIVGDMNCPIISTVPPLLIKFPAAPSGIKISPTGGIIKFSAQ